MKNKTFTVDLSIDAWVRNIQIEAETSDEAKEQLYGMTFEQLLETGYIKDFTISNIDITAENEEDEVEEDDEEFFWEADDEDEAFSNEPQDFESDVNVLSAYAKELTKLTGKYFALTKTASGQIGIETQRVISDEDEKRILEFFKVKNKEVLIFNYDGVIRVLK